MLTQPFSDRLFDAVQRKKSVVVIGLDPDLSLIPSLVFDDEPADGSARTKAADGITRFLKQIIDATADIAVAVKPQLAYFERLGPAGLKSYEEVISYARHYELLVITDGKRNDIASTASQYAIAYLGKKGQSKNDSQNNQLDKTTIDVGDLIRKVDLEGPKSDALTINGYLGDDGIRPFMDQLDINQGLFVLVKTSNPSSGDLQDLTVGSRRSDGGDKRDGAPGRSHSEMVYEHVASWVEQWNKQLQGQLNYGPVGAVVGATYPEQLVRLRQRMPSTPFLIPGFGTQGGTAYDVLGGFDRDGLGAVVNSSRGILYAYKKNIDVSFDQAAREAAIVMRDSLWKAITDR